MTTIHQKHEILDSLNVLDQKQAEKVIDYISSMLKYPKEEVTHQQFKNQALEQIKQALSRAW